MKGLLDPAPLRNSVHRLVDFPALHCNVRNGTLGCLAVGASPAANPRNTVFVECQGQPELPAHPTIEYVATTLSGDHLMASAAIPMLFPAVRVHQPTGSAGWYYDGSARLNTPLDPALELGVDRLVESGARKHLQMCPERLARIAISHSEPENEGDHELRVEVLREHPARSARPAGERAGATFVSCWGSLLRCRL